MTRTFEPLVRTVLALTVLVSTPTHPTTQFTSKRLAQATASVDCLDWEIRGICLKLRCGFFGCRIRSTPWIEHRIPDLVVSAYDEPGETPWTEARALYGKPVEAVTHGVSGALFGMPLGGGHDLGHRRGSEPESRGSTGNLRFKETMIVGNPAVVAFREWLSSGTVPLFCPTRVRPMELYFSSEIDAGAWRTGLAEQLYPESWSPNRRTIGDFPQGMWGTVYPRQGQIHQYWDVLASAVIAQRGVDIATRDGQPHLYRRVPGISASDEDTDQWQLVHPRTETECRTFGRDADYHEGRENGQDGGYSWIYWPLHHCCPGRGRTIARIRF